MNFNVELLFIHLSACKWRNLNICDGLHIFSHVNLLFNAIRARQTETESFKALVPTEMVLVLSASRVRSKERQSVIKYYCEFAIYVFIFWLVLIFSLCCFFLSFCISFCLIYTSV